MRRVNEIGDSEEAEDLDAEMEKLLVPYVTREPGDVPEGRGRCGCSAT